jgi:hydrogenase expression/formation protein HypC
MCLAVPGKIISIEERGGERQDAYLWRIAKVSFNGILKEISLAYLPQAQIGDYVVVHVGLALSIIDPEEAENTLTDLLEI